jgi:hypothetical protein
MPKQTPEPSKELTSAKEIGDCLEQLIAEMDLAIAQAIENPLLFLDGPFLSAIESRCASLAAIEDRAAVVGAEKTSLQAVGKRRENPSGRGDAALTALVWEVRGRAGRLQRLLDSASQFYSTCFSAHGSECLDYGVHGEWGQVANASHLAIDC